MNVPIDSSLFPLLDEEPPGRPIQLPLRIVTRPGLRHAHLVGSEGELTVELDTMALPMGLRMHLMAHCESMPCAVWVEGTWGPLVGEAEPDRPVFAVRKVVGPCEGTAEFAVLL